MKTVMAYCGLICESCPIHLATLEQDTDRQQAMRESIAEQCAEHYGMDLHPDDITDCDGCLANTGRLFSGCLQCEIRKCAREKGIENCAYCDDFACKILLDHFSLDPGAKTRLEEIRKTI